MVDRVTDYGLKSLSRHLTQNVPSISNAYIVTPDFDWNRKPSPTDPGNKKVSRPLPYVAIFLNTDSTPPFTVGNILYEQNIDVHLYIVASNYTEMVDISSDVKQSLKSAINIENGAIGITLYDFSNANYEFYDVAGTLQVDIGQTQYFGPTEVKDENSLKYRSVTNIVLSAFKDSTATLLENKGRVNHTDT